MRRRCRNTCPKAATAPDAANINPAGSGFDWDGFGFGW